MQVLLDNLSALIISGILILGLQVTQVRSQHSSIEQIASHSVKAKTLVFGQWVERDILDLGANFGTNLYRFDEPTVDSLGNSTGWRFFSDDVDASGNPVRVMKRYRLIPTATSTFRDTTFQLYRLDRDSLVVGLDSDGDPLSYSESDWVNSGKSIGTLSFFQVDLLDRMGEVPCPTPDDEIKDANGLVIGCTGAIDVYKADYIRVRFGVVPEYVLKPDNYIRELYWSKTLKVRPYWTPPPTLSS